jgi:TorA maturation chaperone TorD
LEFLSFLSEKGYGNYMTDFINMCMVNWIERWNADVDRYAKTDFYRGIANMAVGGVLYELRSVAAPTG